MPRFSGKGSINFPARFSIHEFLARRPCIPASCARLAGLLLNLTSIVEFKRAVKAALGKCSISRNELSFSQAMWNGCCGEMAL